MSDPSRILRNLNLGDNMPVTRAQSQATQRERGRTNPLGRPTSTSSSERPRALRETQIQSINPFEPPPSETNLHFTIDRLQRERTGTDSYYAFRFRPVSVLIRDPDNGGLGSVWLHDALHAVLLDRSLPGSPTDEMEVSNKISQLYPLIAEGQASIPTRLNALRTGRATSGGRGSENQESSVSDNLFARRDVLCDLLSSFDAQQLPDEFRSRFVDNLPPVTTVEDCFVQGNLPATIYQMGILDEAIFEALRHVVPRDHCAARFYKKQQGRAKRALQQLDANRQMLPELPRSPIPHCGRTLRQIVLDMCKDRDARSSQQPLGAAPAGLLAEILVLLVEEVCDRDEDIYSGPVEGHRAEPHRNRNLYTYLIRDPPRDASVPRWMKEDFVVDRLREFASSEWAPMFEKLQSIFEQIHENAGDGEGASLAYANKIDEMLRDYTAHADEPSSSTAQMRLMGP